MFDANPDAGSDDVFVDLHISQIQIAVGRNDEALARQKPHLENFAATNFTIRAMIFTHVANTYISRGRSEDLVQATKLLDQAQQIAEESGLNGQMNLIKISRTALETASTTATRADGLTNRELEILALVATGKSNPEIAEELFISRHTVVRHVSNILEKIGAKNRSQAAVYAIDRDIA